MTKLKRIIAVLCAVAMCMSLFSVNVFADETKLIVNVVADTTTDDKDGSKIFSLIPNKDYNMGGFSAIDWKVNENFTYELAEVINPLIKLDINKNTNLLIVSTDAAVQVTAGEAFAKIKVTPKAGIAPGTYSTKLNIVTLNDAEFAPIEAESEDFVFIVTQKTDLHVSVVSEPAVIEPGGETIISLIPDKDYNMGGFSAIDWKVNDNFTYELAEVINPLIKLDINNNTNLLIVSTDAAVQVTAGEAFAKIKVTAKSDLALGDYVVQLNIVTLNDAEFAPIVASSEDMKITVATVVEPTATPTVEPTDPPVPAEAKDWDFGKAPFTVDIDGVINPDTTLFPFANVEGKNNYTVSKGVIDGSEKFDGLEYLTTDVKGGNYQPSSKNFTDDYKSSWGIKTAVSDKTSSATNGVFKFAVADDAKVTVYAQCGSSSGSTNLHVSAGTYDSKTASIAMVSKAAEPLEVLVASGLPAGDVFVHGDNNAQVYRIVVEYPNDPNPTATVDPEPTATAPVDPDPTATAPVGTPDPTGEPTEAPTATPIPKAVVTVETDKDVDSIKLVDVDGVEYVLTATDTDTGKVFTGEVPVGYYTVDATPVADREIDLANSDLDITVTVSGDNKLKIVTVDKSSVDTVSIATYPTKSLYKDGENYDPTGLTLIVKNVDGTDETVIYNDETKDAFTFKPAVIKKDTTTVEVIYGNRSQKYTIASRGTIAIPVAKYVPATEVEIPADALYTASNITWSPAAETFGYSTVYTANYVITANDGYTLNSSIFATINGKDADIVVAEDGKTATVSYTFPATNKKPSGSGGPSGSSTNATSTPKPSATTGPNVTTPPSEQVFQDVPSSHWAFEDINTLYKAGIIDGYSATQFLPDGKITRAEFTKLIAVMFDLKSTSTTSQFDDVNSSDWYVDYVIAATEAGIIKGYSETEFAPNQNITREQMATVIGRELGATSTTALKYTDASDIEEYALPYVTGLTSKGYLKGDENNQFRPKDTTTRAEAATLLNRVYQAEVDKGEPVATATPATTADPKATKAPEVTATPEVSATPGVTATPAA